MGGVRAAILVPLHVLRFCIIVMQGPSVLLCADRNILEALSLADGPAEGPNQLHDAPAEKRPSFALQAHPTCRPLQATMTAHDLEFPLLHDIYCS